VRLEGLGQLKNPRISSGIKFRDVSIQKKKAQNRCCIGTDENHEFLLGGLVSGKIFAEQEWLPESVTDVLTRSARQTALSDFRCRHSGRGADFQRLLRS
jgi:hypothetical protein